MGQAVSVANASGDKVYVKVQSSVQLSEKTDFTVAGSAPTASTGEGGSATGKLDVEVKERVLCAAETRVCTKLSSQFRQFWAVYPYRRNSLLKSACVAATNCKKH